MAANSLSVADFLILIAITLAITYGGHLLAGAIKDRHGFFQAGNSMPWWAVSSSIIATVISSVTFISVPAAVFRPGGDLGYFQILLGLMLGKVLIALVFVRPYYESGGIRTTYDYIGGRIDSRVGVLSMGFGIALGSIAASIRIVTTGLVLAVITGWPLPACMAGIAAFAVLWSWMAGLKTVIWTDFLLFIVFTAGAVFAILWLSGQIGMSWSEAWAWLDGQAKLRLIDLSTDPQKRYTLWAGLIGASLLGLAQAGQQGTMQRVRACRSVGDARKAYFFSSFFYLTPICMLALGLLLSVFYAENPLPPAVVADLAEQPDRILPHFIATEIPSGVSVIFIAAIFAAGISTLDTTLTEIADVSIANIYERYIRRDASERHYLLASRLAVLLWGILFTLAALFVSGIQAEGLLNLTFKLPNYVNGSILGTVILARIGVGSWPTYLAGLVTATLSVAVMNLAWNVGFFWWCPASAAVMIVTVWLLDRCTPEWSGITNSPRRGGSEVTNVR